MATSPRGQSLAEYSIGVAVVVAALVAMSLYAKRSLQGRWADAIGARPAANMALNQTQYEPYYADSTITTSANTAGVENTTLGANITRTLNETYRSTIRNKEQAQVPAGE
jgi:hypothetical protein